MENAFRRTVCFVILSLFVGRVVALGEEPLNYNANHRPVLDIRRVAVSLMPCGAEEGETKEQNGEYHVERRYLCSNSSADTASITLSAIESTADDSFRVEYSGAPYGRAVTQSRHIFDYYRIAGPLYEADLNGDGVPDFVHEFGSSANGLGTEQRWLAFLLSGPSSYQLRVVEAWSPMEDDFFTLDKNGAALFMHTLFLRLDGAHGGSYWLYNLITFRGYDLVSANERAKSFPYWIRYTNRPNHEDDKGLSASRRRESLTAAGFGWLAQ